jgi:hypothetical protein
MTVATRDNKLAAGIGAGDRARRLFDPGGDRSLDDVVVTAWSALAVRGNAVCLVCGETAVRGDAGDAAECPRCGSGLE